ncbi:diguanylate cyclase [Sphingosinicella sp. CPCC 101087]|uniref:sensor domain-containing diguanylate cyclase n=1 Tax=Sphingosinicella sp. CPCC 101087 TaxID=2497754 RepID=UPI0013ED2A92|nr:diguanylate cyclase [Sphingosinicella sp. CPCC 101087]
MWRFLVLAVLAWMIPSGAAAADLKERFCHAVAPLLPDSFADLSAGSLARAEPPALRAFACSGGPGAYRGGRLWLRAPLDAGNLAPGEAATLLIHMTRFDRLTVRFQYADGHSERFQVASGDYGQHWRVGGQLAFTAPAREARVEAIVLGLDRLATWPHLRVRLLPGSSAASEASLAAALVGAAIALLGLSTLYNFLLSIASRRGFVAWHAAWVGTVFVWGLLWSQLALLVMPGIAGTLTAQLCTLLSTFAITFATACAVAMIDPGRGARWIRSAVLICGLAIALVGAVAAFPPASLPLPLLGTILGILVLADLLGVVLLIGWSWWRGDKGARDYALAWGLPMATLASTEIIDYGPALLGGGSQLAVLLASALQTLWLSVAMTLRLAKMRAERDAAQAARHEMQLLAERDPLTGLLNRRGFVARAERALRGAPHGFTLLLIDVDNFKSVNDGYGHDIGDSVLRVVADAIDRESGSAVAGRMGGEEFAIGADALRTDPIKLASAVLESVAGLDLVHLFGEPRQVTVSIGVAHAAPGSGFEAVYREADRALYAAKNGGRNRVALFGGGEGGRPAMSREKPAKQAALRSF